MLEKPDLYTIRAISCRNGSWKHHFLHSCNSVIQTMPKSCALDNEPASFSPNAALIKAFREESAKISLKAVEKTSLREQTSKSSLNTARITRFREQTPTVLFEQPSKQAFWTEGGLTGSSRTSAINFNCKLQPSRIYLHPYNY